MWSNVATHAGSVSADSTEQHNSWFDESPPPPQPPQPSPVPPPPPQPSHQQNLDAFGSTSNELTVESVENMSIEEMLAWSARSVASVAEEQKALESKLAQESQETEGDGMSEWTLQFQDRLSQLRTSIGELKDSMQENETNLENFGRTIDNKIAELEKEHQQMSDESGNV